MKKLLAIYLVLTLGMAFAEKEATTKDVMHDAYYSLTQLLPLISNELKFSAFEEEKKITEHISRMSLAFKKGEHQNMLNSPTFKPSIEAILENLEAAQVSFNNKNKNFARLRLNAAASLCITCHSQIPKNNMVSMIVDDKDLHSKLKEDHYELGNLYFILRQYEKSIDEYENFIKEYLSENKKSGDGSIFEYFNRYLFSAYFNSIYITAKAMKDPAKTLKVVSDLRKTNPPPYIVGELNMWEYRAKKWNEKYPKLAKQKIDRDFIKSMVEDIRKTIVIENDTIISGDFDYDLMILSGILSTEYYKNHKSYEGETLYWMGLAEYRLGKTLFYNLGDQYLKECINAYPKMDIAKKCYNALVAEINFRNTGSSGTHIPKEVKAELKELKKKLK